MDFILEHYINFYVCGSKCYPFVRKPHDIDIIVTFIEDGTKQELKPIMNSINRIKKQLGCDIMFMSTTRPNIWAWIYSHEFINILGSDTLNFNLFERPDRIIPVVKNHYERYMEIKHPKRMYDIIYYYYIIKNGGYFLTEPQARRIESWHDGNYDWAFFKNIIDEIGLEWIDPKGEKANENQI